MSSRSRYANGSDKRFPGTHTHTNKDRRQSSCVDTDSVFPQWVQRDVLSPWLRSSEDYTRYFLCSEYFRMFSQTLIGHYRERADPTSTRESMGGFTDDSPIVPHLTSLMCRKHKLWSISEAQNVYYKSWRERSQLKAEFLLPLFSLVLSVTNIYKLSIMISSTSLSYIVHVFVSCIKLMSLHCSAVSAGGDEFQNQTE